MRKIKNNIQLAGQTFSQAWGVEFSEMSKVDKAWSSNASSSDPMAVKWGERTECECFPKKDENTKYNYVVQLSCI